MVTRCTFAQLEPRRWRCERCGRVVASASGTIWATCGAGAVVPGVAGCGVGCQLAGLLRWWGIVTEEECGCRSYAAQMDAWGPDGCAGRRKEIVWHLSDQAAARGMRFSRLAARVLLWRAISLARREGVGHAAAESKAETAGANVAGSG